MTAKRTDTPRTGSTTTGSNLRQQAEALLRNQPEGKEDIVSSPPEDWHSLLHELHVHQIELEMQNEELRQAQAEAESARDRYIALYDFAPVGYLSLRQPGIILAANLTAAQMLGVPRSQLIGSRLARFVFGEDQDACYHYLKALFRPEARGILEVRLVKYNEGQFYARLEASAQDGEDIIQLVISDVTDLKRAEQALQEMNATLELRVAERTAELRESEQRYSAIFDKSPIGFALTSMPEGVTLSVNDAFLELFERTREGVIGKTITDLGITDASSRAQVVAELQAHGSVRNFECTRTTKSGARRILSLNLDWVSIGGEEHILATIRDITKRRIAEEELRRAHDELELRVQDRTRELEKTNKELKAEIAERLRVESQLRLQSAALDAAANSIIITENQGNIRWANPAFTHMTGYTLDEVLGQNPRLLKSGQQDESFYRLLWETILGGQVWRGEMVNRRKDGSLYYEEQTITPLPDEKGEITHFIAIKQDITERKQAEMQLACQNQELRAMSEAEHRQRELAEGLAQSVIALTSSLELEDVLNVVLDQIRRAVPFQGADIALIEGKTFHVAGFLGFEDMPASVAAMQREYVLDDFPLFRQICTTFQPVLVHDTREEADWRVIPGMEWVRSYLAAPLISDGQVTGIINLTSDQPGFFSPETKERVVAFAAPAALALRNAQIYKAELAARRVTETLSAAALALTRTLDLDQVINILLDHLGAIVPSDLTGVALLEGETRLGMVALRGFGHWAEANLPTITNLEVEDFPSLQKAISTRNALLIPVIDQYTERKDMAWIREFHSWLMVPIVAGEKVIGIVGLGKEEAGHFTREHQQWVEALVSQSSVALQNAWLFEQVRASRERLQFLSRRLVEVQENERRYVAQELHDEIGQSLTSLLLGLQLIEKEAHHPERVIAEAEEMGKGLESAMENLHRLGMDLRPTSLDQLGLEAALRQHIKYVNRRFNLEIQFEMIGIGERLPARMEIALYRIVQEALNNIVRHAKASRADVLIQTRDDNLILIVEDNGVGFDPETAVQSDRLGIFGMRERAEMLGGQLTIESSPGKGTTVLVEVPDEHANPHR